MVLTIVGVIVVLLLAGIGWCIWRFIKKKRPKGAEEKDKQDDENALVDNEEANAEEVRRSCIGGHMSILYANLSILRQEI